MTDPLPLLSCLSKPYDQRHPLDHRLLTDCLAPFFPTYTTRKLKLISFFLQHRTGPTVLTSQSFSPHSFVIVYSPLNPERAKLHILKQKEIHLSSGELAMVLDYDKYLSCQALGDSSIEQELSFMESSQYFCSMSRRKFLQLLREAKVINFKQNGCAYQQGQQVTQTQSGSGIYLVRHGEFGGYRNDGRELEAFRFQKGHVFGALEIMGREGLASGERVLTVRCKSQTAPVYHFDTNIFSHLIRHHCEEIIRQKQSKLMRYLPIAEQSRSVQEPNRSRKGSVSMNSSYYTPFTPNDTLTLTHHPTLTLTPPQPTTTTITKPSQQLEQSHLKKTSYFSLRKQGPLKHYPLASQTSNFTTSEFRDLSNPSAPRHHFQTLLQRANRSSSLQKRDVMQTLYRQTLHLQLKRACSKH